MSRDWQQRGNPMMHTNPANGEHTRYIEYHHPNGNNETQNCSSQQQQQQYYNGTQGHPQNHQITDTGTNARYDHSYRMPQVRQKPQIIDIPLLIFLKE